MKIKYLLLTNGASYYPSLLKSEIGRAGLYNWARCFEGNVEVFQRFKGKTDGLLEYDVIHINLAGGDIGLANELRNLIGDEAPPKIVVNLDYSVHYFPQALKKNPNIFELLLRDLEAADMVFGVEPCQVSLLNYFMKTLKKNKRSPEAALIPHPVDVRKLSSLVPKGLFIPFEDRNDVLAYQFHRYDGQWEIPKMLMHDLPPPEEGGTVLRACLGFTEDYFPTSLMPELVMPMLDWSKYIYFLSTCLWGFEYRTHSASSRFIMECASIGIPVVSTDYSYLGTKIFPDLSFKMDDYTGIRKALEHIITDEEYRRKTAERGLQGVKRYSFLNSADRFIEELDKRIS